MENKISSIIKNDVLTEVLQSIETIEKNLPFLLNLSDDERQGGFRLGDKNLGFLTKTKDYMKQNPEFMPAYVSIDEVTKDAVLAEQLTTVERKLSILTDKINDTGNIAGMEALSGALVYYNSVKEAAKNNVNGAITIYQDLKTRFPGARKVTPSE